MQVHIIFLPLDFALFKSQLDGRSSVISASVSFQLCFSPAGVAVALKQAMTSDFKAYQMQVLVNCKSLSNALIDFGYKIVTGTCRSTNAEKLVCCFLHLKKLYYAHYRFIFVFIVSS